MTYHAVRQRGSYGNEAPGKIDAKVPPASWWLKEGVISSECHGAYLSKGADSYTVSKQNLNSSSFNLSDGSIPVWTFETGWDFTPNNYLAIDDGGIISKPITVIARVVFDDTNSARAICGASGYDGLEWRTYSGKMQIMKQRRSLIATSSLSVGTGVDYVVAVSYSSSGEYAFYINGSDAGTGTNNQSLPENITKIAGSFEEFMNGHIYAIAFYKDVLSPTQVSAISDKMETL